MHPNQDQIGDEEASCCPLIPDYGHVVAMDKFSIPELHQTLFQFGD